MTYRFPTFAAAVVLALAAALPCRAGEFETLREQSKRNAEMNFRNYGKNVGKFRMMDIARFAIDHGRLTIISNLPAAAANTPCQVEIEGMPGPTMLMYFNRPDIPQAMRLTLNHYDFSDPKAYQIVTTLNYYPQQLSISRSIQTLDENISINFNQNQNVGVPQGNSVTLIVSRSKRMGGGGAPIQCVAPDLKTLRQQFPKPVSDYLRPMMRDLGDHSIFSVDTLTARQVFAREWKIDPAVADQIQKLVELLNDNSFRQREAAVRKLRQVLPDAMLVLRSLDRKALSPEQNTLIEEVLSDCPSVSPEDVEKSRGDPEFLIDCLTCEDLGARKIALDRLTERYKKPLKFDVNAAPDDREAAAATLRAELTPH